MQENDNSFEENEIYSNENESQIIQKQPEQNQQKENLGPQFIFYVKKLGQKGWSHKPRILIINSSGVFYYRMAENKSANKDFLTYLKQLKESNETEYNEEKFRILFEKFTNLDVHEKIEKGHFEKYTVQVIDKISTFDKFPIKIKQGQNLDINQSYKNEDPKTTWYFETYKEHYRKKIIEAYGIIQEALRKRAELENPQDNENFISNKNIPEEDIKIKDKDIIKKKEFDEKDKIHFVEFSFQKQIKNYFEVIRKLNDPTLQERDETIKQKLYLELNIYHEYRAFVKHCEKVVELIIYDLSTFEKADVSSFQRKIHPIVFPNPFYFSQENNAVLLYSIWGVNYTLTWHHLRTDLFKKQFAFSKGKWKGLKTQFRQKDYFQDLLMKLASFAEKVNEFPCITMSCVIDYNGFRVLCESDIFTTEENVEGLKLKLAQMNTSIQHNNTNNRNINVNGKNNGMNGFASESMFVNNLSKFISGINEKGEKLDNYTLIYNINPKDISNEKSFDLEKYYKTLQRDYEMTFERADGYQHSSNSSVNNNQGGFEGRGDIHNSNIQNNPQTNSNDKYDKNNQFIQTEKQFLKCAMYIYSDNPNNVLLSPELSFDRFSDKVQNPSYSYLMQFDVLIPNTELNHSNIFYRREITFKRINPFILDDNNNNDNSLLGGAGMRGVSQITIGGYKEDTDNNTVSKTKEKEQLLLNIIRNNTYQNNPSIVDELKPDFQLKLKALLMALDSLYLVPYNSETLKLCFHYYGINLHYLGTVASRTTVPHIRELCLIEMFARVCKKIIFDLIAQSTFDKAMTTFYSQIKELTTTLNKVPVTFNLSYGNEYLKSITQPVERGRFPSYNGIEITGLYLNDDDYPLKEQKDPNNKKDSSDIENSQLKYQALSNFFTVLLGENTMKANLDLYDNKYTSTQELWDFIIDTIREQYKVENEDVFMYCKLDSMSIFALISAIQYHTGIKFQNGLNGLLEKVQSQKFDTAIFESITPIPKTTYYSFSQFMCKQHTILPLTNNFAMYFPSNLIYYQAKLNYYAEKYLYNKKISQNYYYVYYLKILKGWDIDRKAKKLIQSNTPKEFDKNITVNDNVPVQMYPIFEDNFDMFISLICSQYQPKTSLVNNNVNKNEHIEIQMKSDNNYLYTCEKIISLYFNPKHPFISILKSCYAKALYKNSYNRKEENKIDMLFINAVDIAKNCVGELNVFFGKLARDVGMFFDKNLKFYKAYQMYMMSAKVFDKHKSFFMKDYFYSLKYLTKACVYLGRLQEGLKCGHRLIREIYEQSEISSSSQIGSLSSQGVPIAVNDPLKMEEIDNIKSGYNSNNNNMNNNARKYWNMLHNLEGFTINLMKIAKHLTEYEIGIDIGNIFFKILPGNPPNFVLNPFKNWLKTSTERVKEIQNIRNDQTNKGEYRYNSEIRLMEYEKDYNGKDKRIDNVIKLYLKCLIKSLKGVDNQTYAKAYVRYIERTKDNKKKANVPESLNDEFYKLFFRKGKERFDEYFKTKILYSIKQKFETEKYSGDEMEASFRKAVKELKLIYYKFKDSKLFKL